MIEQAFFKQKESELGVSLNEMQKQAVLHTDGPLLLLATPGSGKTTTIIMRIGYLIETLNIAPTKIKAVTFSKAAAEDMVVRFGRFFPEMEPVDFSTIHSLAFSVVRDYFNKRQEGYELVEGANARYNKKMILRHLYEEINGRVITTDHLEALLSYISYIKNKMIPRHRWDKVTCEVKNALEIFERYEQFKREGAESLLLDYDDMLSLADEALASDQGLLETYQAKYEYVLTDESQDTSLVQHAIIEKIVAQHKNICVVADDDQSIYTWRAAEPAYLLNFKEVYPEATILTMTQNYRSSGQIVTVTNQFIKQNKNRYDKEMFTENEMGDPIVFRNLPTYEEQAGHLVSKINRAGRYDDVAILYRNNLSSIVLVDALDKVGIPFYMKDTNNRFFEHWVVEDMLNFMRMAYDDTRVTTLERIFTKFNGYISKVQLERLKREPSKQSVFDRLSNNSHLKEYQVKNLQKIKGHFKDMTLVVPSKIIQIIRNDLKYDEAIERISDKFGFNLTYLHEILHILEEIAVGTKTMEAFAKRLHYLKDLLREAQWNKASNAVTLSTLHSSKGLEFKEVYMIDLVEGNLPAHADIDAEADGDTTLMEEAIRLFYVGMTRAESRLELLTYKKKVGSLMDVSRFYEATQYIVNPKMKKEKKRAIAINSGRKKSPKQSSRTLNPNAVQSVSDLVIGAKVKHRVFGSGEVEERSEDEVLIQFSKEKKRLLLATCMEYRLLEIIE